jgi:transposase
LGERFGGAFRCDTPRVGLAWTVREITHPTGWLGISPCIPSRAGRKVKIPHDAALYRLRHKIENMFARLKDWRRIATRYDRCLILFLSACALAAIVIYWL